MPQQNLAAVRSVGITPEEGRTLVRQVTGWPQFPEKPKPWENDEQAKLDADLETLLSGYFQELGENAYAAFNTMTDIASRPPQSPRFRRDRPSLERRAGAWLRDFQAAASRPGFSVASHLDSLSKSAAATPSLTAERHPQLFRPCPQGPREGHIVLQLHGRLGERGPLHREKTPTKIFSIEYQRLARLAALPLVLIFAIALSAFCFLESFKLSSPLLPGNLKT